VHAENRFHRETLEQAVLDHLARTAAALFRRLKDQIDRAVEMAILRKILGSRKQHRSMAVMPSVQGKGVGHVLLNAVNEFADRSEHDRVFLHTTYFVPGAGEMYAKHGFRWVRDTTAEEWYGVPGLEMERSIEKQHATGS